MQLVGSAALVVTFVDAVDGRALTPEAMTVNTAFESKTGATVMSIFGLPTSAASAGFDGKTRIEGLVPGTSTHLNARFPKHFAASHEVSDIAPGETRRVTKRVERARSVLGSIVDSSGAPVQSVTVATVGGQSDGALSLGPNKAIIINGSISVGQGAGGPGVTTTLASRSSRSNLMGQLTRTAATATGDAAGRFELHGLGPGPTQVEAHFTPWHRETITLPALDRTRAAAVVEEAPPIVLHAPGPCSADLQFVVPRGMTLAHYDVSLQLGDAPWLLARDKIAPLVDDQQIMKLRGLTAAPCRLDVRLRDNSVWPPVARDTVPSSLTFEFVPCADAPTRVRVDLGPLVGGE